MASVKELMLREFEAELAGSSYAFISAFENASVEQISQFRSGLRKTAKRSLVVKHALAKKAFEKLNFAEAKELLKGSVIITFGDKDPQAVSKAIVEQSKNDKSFSPCGVIFDKKVCDVNFVKQLASLPSREELLTQLVIRVKSPISGFVLNLGGLMRGLVQAISEIKKQREAETAA